MRQRNKVHMDGVLAVLLLGVFAACVLAVLLAGADGYQRLTQRDREAYSQRTAAQYLATRIRQADTAAGVAVEPFGPDGPDTLSFYEQIEGTTYVTRIYCYDGYLRELFSAADTELLPADGEKVLEMQSLTLSDDGQGISAWITDPQGNETALYWTMRSMEEAVEE